MKELDVNFNEIVNMIKNKRANAFKKVNEELISLYWEVGEYLNNQVKTSQYGDKIVDKLEKFMKDNYPEMQGFSRRNLYRMIQFYNIYKDDKIVSPLVTQLSWTNNCEIMSNCKEAKEREFYIKLAIKENYTKVELKRQLGSSYYERYMLSKGKAPLGITELIDEDDYPNTRILDTYTLEFLDLPNEYSEKDLQKAIIKNMKNFVLEIGKDFTFISEEFRVQVGNSDFYIDLLFYNRELKCLVAFELKLGEFKPEYVSKMNFYLEALDRDVKKKHENPSVGIILCSSKDDEIVEYSMSKNMTPTMVSEYKLKLIDKKLLENKLKQISDILDKNS